VKKSIIGMSLLASLAMIGCVSTSTGGLEVGTSEGGAATVRIDDSFFAQHIALEDVKSCRTDRGFLSASVRFRNKYDKDLSVLYKFTWFDANGMEVQPDGRPWEYKILHGGECGTFAATAPESNVMRFVVRVRRMK